MEKRKIINNPPLYTLLRGSEPTDGTHPHRDIVSDRRIPSFLGDSDACEHFRALPAFKSAKTVKVHPSLSATRLRQIVLEEGKDLLVPPLPEHDFLYYLLSPRQIEPRLFSKVSTRSGWVKHGIPLSLAEIPQIDLVVVASVAVAPSGARLGKGMGYGEIEYGICTEIGAVRNKDDDDGTRKTMVATIVHDTQLVEDHVLGQETLEAHDLAVDIICTPIRVIHTHTRIPRPRGIIWDIVTPDMFSDIGALKALRAGCTSHLPGGGT